MQQVIDPSGAVEGLWELEASTLGLTDGETYHYWFEVDNRLPDSVGRIQTTDSIIFLTDAATSPTTAASRSIRRF
jgi:hypothetical protein